MSRQVFLAKSPYSPSLHDVNPTSMDVSSVFITQGSGFLVLIVVDCFYMTIDVVRRLLENVSARKAKSLWAWLARLF
jgi:hypothetical protein